ncbi:hypothetical protein HK096_010342, partial [Nowakowskiella sp. JEL0078]
MCDKDVDELEDCMRSSLLDFVPSVLRRCSTLTDSDKSSGSQSTEFSLDSLSSISSPRNNNEELRGIEEDQEDLANEFENFSSRLGPGGLLHCDLCSKKANDRRLKNNHCTVTNPAVQICTTCKLQLCQLHCDTHSDTADTENHLLVSGTDILELDSAEIRRSRVSRINSSFCGLHPAERMVVYCHECSRLICIFCGLTATHKGHSIELGVDCSDRVLKNFKETEVSKVESVKVGLEMELENVTRAFDQQMGSLNEMKGSIREFANDLRNAITKSEEMLLSQLGDVEEQTKLLLRSVETKVRNHLGACDLFREEFRLIEESDDCFAFLKFAERLRLIAHVVRRKINFSQLINDGLMIASVELDEDLCSSLQKGIGKIYVDEKKD